MKLLITGASGFLGHRAAIHFGQLGYEVLTPSHRQLDITDTAAVAQWFESNHPQAVLHCAAISDTAACQKNPEGSYLVNVQGSLNLAAACAKTGVRFIFCSSDQVYADSPLPGPHKETEHLTPTSVYAKQKLLAEQLCTEACPDTVCLRLSWMYSAHSLPAEHGHLVTTLLSAIRNPSLPLTWPLHDKRGITDADQVAAQLPKALALPSGVYNFGAENDRDTYHTVRAVLEELALTDALERLQPNLQAFALRPRDIRMDTSLAASFGIAFPSTVSGLLCAMTQCISDSAE